MNNKYKILKETFGHDGFRSFQEEVVDTIIAKQDVLTILPTGGGKSGVLEILCQSDRIYSKGLNNESNT